MIFFSTFLRENTFLRPFSGIFLRKFSFLSTFLSEWISFEYFLGKFTFLSTFKSTFLRLFRTQNLYVKKNKENTKKKYLHALPLLDRCQCNSKCWWKYFAKWRLSQNSLWADKAQMRVAARNGRGRKFAKTILKNEKGGETAKTISKKEKGRKIAKTISVFAIMWLFWGSHGVTWWCGSHFFIDKKVLI